MKIVIIGAGEVGYNIANRLASENKHVTVIDKNPDAIRHISENIDVRALVGSGSSPSVLLEAGIQDADLLLAVTDSDEINLVACLLANTLVPEVKKLARLRNADFDSFHEIFKHQAPYIDTIISPEAEVVKTIRTLMEVPKAVDVGSFMDNQVVYVGVRIDKNCPMTGLRLIDFPLRFGEDRPLITAIIRNNKVIVPRGGHKIEEDDLVYFIAERKKFQQTLKLFNIRIRSVSNALIIGGGRIGTLLAKSLEKDHIKVKIIESNLERCKELSEQMDQCVVLHGDGSDQKLFMEENIGHSDAVVCVTNDDEANILISLLAQNMGVSNTITRIGNASYSPLLQTLGIEKTVSSRSSAVSSILRDVREGKVLSDLSILGEHGEFIEAIALEDSEITNTPLKDIRFPKGSLLACIMRDNSVTIPTGDSTISPGDRIILFSVPQALKKLENLMTMKLNEE